MNRQVKGQVSAVDLPRVAVQRWSGVTMGPSRVLEGHEDSQAHCPHGFVTTEPCSTEPWNHGFYMFV